MGITLYFNERSPPSRNVKTTMKVLGLEFEIKYIDLQKREQRTPEYLAINPRGRVPCVIDGDYVIHESRAIATYLCSKYEKGDDSTRLYPTDLESRGNVDKLLYISEAISDMVLAYVNLPGVVYKGEIWKKENFDQLLKAYDLCENYLSKNKWIAADHLTIADFFMSSPFHMLNATAGSEGIDNYPKTADWLKRIRAISCFDECNKTGLEITHNFWMQAMQRQKSSN